VVLSHAVGALLWINSSKKVIKNLFKRPINFYRIIHHSPEKKVDQNFYFNSASMQKQIESIFDISIEKK
jgi:hypothetical protein